MRWLARYSSRPLSAPKPLHEFEALKREAIEPLPKPTDAYIQNWTRFVIGWEEFHRGRMNEARECGSRAYASWSTLNDPTLHWDLAWVVELDCTGVGIPTPKRWNTANNHWRLRSPHSIEVCYLRQGMLPWCCFGETDEGAKLLEDHRSTLCRRWLSLSL